MTHDETDVLDRRWKIPRRHFRRAKNMLVTAETDIRVDLGSQIMCFRRRAEQIDGEVFRSRPCLVMDPARHPWSHMADHTRHLFMRRLHPTVVRWGNCVATGTEFWMIGQGDGDCAER